MPVTFLLDGINIFLVLMSMCNFQCIELIVDRVLKRCRPEGHVQVVITKLLVRHFFQVRVKFQLISEKAKHTLRYV